MGFGLICLLIAERRKKQSTKKAVFREVDRGREPRPLVSHRKSLTISGISAGAALQGRFSRSSDVFSSEAKVAGKDAEASSPLREQRADKRRNEPKTNPYDLENGVRS